MLEARLRSLVAPRGPADISKIIIVMIIIITIMIVIIIIVVIRRPPRGHQAARPSF